MSGRMKVLSILVLVPRLCLEKSCLEALPGLSSGNESIFRAESWQAQVSRPSPGTNSLKNFSKFAVLALMGFQMTFLRPWFLVFAALLMCTGTSSAYAQSSSATVVDIKVEPAQPRTGDTVKIWFNLGKGAERAEVRWSLNGEEAQTSDYVEAVKYVEFDRPVKAGDKIVATITPYDASGDAGKVVVRRIVCASAPPELKVVDQRIEDNSYRARIEARDPQGGTVALSLDAAPPGMKMDPGGSIDWPLGKDTAGRFPVKVRAKTGQGGESVLSFDVGIRR
jgi:hypothetical protein